MDQVHEGDDECLWQKCTRILIFQHYLYLQLKVDWFRPKITVASTFKPICQNYNPFGLQNDEC